MYMALQIREVSGRSNLYCRCKPLLAALHFFMYLQLRQSIFNLKKKVMKLVQQRGNEPGSAVSNDHDGYMKEQ